MEAVKTKTKTAKTKTKTKTVKTKKEKTKTKTKTEKTKCKFLKKFIIVDGTSSSGKTKICKFFTGMNYKCIMTDEYQPIALVQFYKDLPNNYIDNESKEELFTEHLCNAMVKDAIAAKKALIDDISQSGLLKAFDKAGKSDDVFVIVVYAGLKDLARNVNSRRLEGDYRGIFVFTQFAERYIKCIDGDEKKIDTVKSCEVEITFDPPWSKDLMSEEAKLELGML